MRLNLQVLAVIAMAVMLCHPHGLHATNDDALPNLDAPPTASPGPGLTVSFASREVVRRSLEESSLLHVFAQGTTESIDDRHWMPVPVPSRATSFAGLVQSSGIRLQI